MVYEQILNGEITPNFARRNLASELKKLDEVIVTPRTIQNMLEKYLNNSVSARELSEWASFLITSDIYICPDWENDDKAEQYETMWYVLQQISSPEIDGEITTECIIDHINILSRIKT